jgi:hypothetical protein
MAAFFRRTNKLGLMSIALLAGVESFLLAQTDMQLTAQYESVFREYFSLTRSIAEAKDAAKILVITDKFEREHKNLHLAKAVIWNRDLETKNNVLFDKEYNDSMRQITSVEKIHYFDYSKIQVNVRPNHIFIDYSPREINISYRLYFLR